MKEGIRKKVNKIVGYLILGLTALLVISLVKNLGNQAQIKAQIEAERARLAKMKEDNASLEAQALQIQSQDFVEKEIRDKLGLVKAGEAIVVLPDPEVLKSLAPSIPTQADTLPDPNWKKWLKLFL